MTGKTSASSPQHCEQCGTPLPDDQPANESLCAACTDTTIAPKINDDENSNATLLPAHVPALPTSLISPTSAIQNQRIPVPIDFHDSPTISPQGLRSLHVPWADDEPLHSHTQTVVNNLNNHAADEDLNTIYNEPTRIEDGSMLRAALPTQVASDGHASGASNSDIPPTELAEKSSSQPSSPSLAATTSSPWSLQAGEIAAFQYRVVRPIGTGGMGAVYLARDDITGQEVAIKALPPDVANDPAKAARLIEEARALAALDHPNIVPLITLANHPHGAKLLVMKYVAGEALDHRISDAGQLTIAESRSICRDLVSALGYANSRGVVHRDVKPSNILIDRQGRAHLIDFGIARTEERSRITRVGIVVGTPEYMSPEQITGQEVDGRSDLYSAGIVLYEMLCGVPPYTADTPYHVLRAHVENPLPNPRERRADIPDDLLGILRLMLAKDVKKRISDAGRIIAMLDGKLPVHFDDVPANTSTQKSPSALSTDADVSNKAPASRGHARDAHDAHDADDDKTIPPSTDGHETVELPALASKAEIAPQYNFPIPRQLDEKLNNLPADINLTNTDTDDTIASPPSPSPSIKRVSVDAFDDLDARNNHVNIVFDDDHLDTNDQTAATRSTVGNKPIRTDYTPIPPSRNRHWVSAAIAIFIIVALAMGGLWFARWWSQEQAKRKQQDAINAANSANSANSANAANSVNGSDAVVDTANTNPNNADAGAANVVGNTVNLGNVGNPALKNTGNTVAVSNNSSNSANLAAGHAVAGNGAAGNHAGNNGNIIDDDDDMPQGADEPDRLGKDGKDGKADEKPLALRLTDAQIEATTGINAAEAAECYQNLVLSKDPKANGQVILHVTFDPNGAPIDTRILQQTLGDAVFHQCLLRVAKEWRFPTLGAPLDLKKTFVFTPSTSSTPTPKTGKIHRVP